MHPVITITGRQISSAMLTNGMNERAVNRLTGFSITKIRKFIKSGASGHDARTLKRLLKIE